MITITLPDSSEKQFEQAPSVADVAASIGSSLAKAALAGKVDGALVDTSFVIDHDATVSIVTAKDPEGLEVIRHSTAHLLAQAVQQVFDDVQVTIGPVIDDGFYYDFATDHNFTPEDLKKIEKAMSQIVKQNLTVTREELSRDDAIALFEGMGEHYKVEIIKDIPAGETLSLYRQGDFVDLCRGPHVPRTGLLKVFKLTKVAGAYWRGNSDNAMLQRIYGTAWASKDDLALYIKRIEEAEKRDHRLIGKKMNLFHFQPDAPGMAFWHPNGWTLNQVVRQFIRRVQLESGYFEVNTPIMADQSLWEKSGHLAKFGDEMFTTSSENRDYAIKPMNCPCHVQIFNQGLKSYRDLPLRLAEFGSCHRNEPSGALHGLMRVRGFVQDDGHIFCTEEQIQSEVSAFNEQLYKVYGAFGFTDIQVRISTRPEKRVGSDEMWDQAEAILGAALDADGIPWEELPGEGAFYGPKVEYSLTDCLGRVWQCGTMQVDFSMPGRLGAEYVAEDNTKKVPVMLHRAMMGSLERFIAVLIEHYAGELPLWLAPIQMVVLNLTDRQAEKATEIVNQLKKVGIRANSDLRNEKIGFKIREHSMARIPYQLIIGDKELESDTVSVRAWDGTQVSGKSLDDFLADIKADLEPAYSV